MTEKLIYDTIDAMKYIKSKYPYIPIFIIRRVLFANDLYMRSLGIIDFNVTLDHWSFK